MASARGDALDWALALARAPGERHALRQRPLPDGMDVVLQVAAGHAATIEDAAAHAGKPATEMVEAARFYLREMLFFPDADPYRVLGLGADASDELIKHHHRLLQQWLHPDRPTSDWDAAFAARVNAAWSQLRTPARREAYAATLLASPAATDSAPSWSPAVRTHSPILEAGHVDPAPDEGRWRRRAPVLSLFAICAVLGVLAVRDMQREPDVALVGTGVAETGTPDDVPAVALQLPAPAPDQASAKKPAVAQKPPPKRVAAAPVPRVQPVPMPATAAAKPGTPVAPRPVAVASKPIPQPITPPERQIAPPPVAVAAVPKPAPAKPAATALAPAPAGKPPVALAAAVPPKQAARTAAVTVPVLPAKPAAKSAAVVAPQPPVVAVSKPVATTPTKPAPVAGQPPVTKPREVAAPAVATAPVAGPAPPTSSPEQVAQAQQTGQRLLAFVAGRGGGMPPIWANLTAQTQASRARDALQGNGRIAVGTPDWRVGDNSAAMQTSLTPRDGGARRLRVDMVWREQRWLVAGLTLEQAP